jgi:type IV secretion system protein VirD4
MKRAAKVAAVILAAGVCLWLFNQPDVQRNFEDHPVGVTLTLLAIAGYVFFTWKYGGTEHQPEPQPELPDLSGNYGTAQWAPQNTTIPTGMSDFGGVFFGKSSSPEVNNGALTVLPGSPVCSTPKRHTLIVAQTQSGKATRIGVPTLLRNSRRSFFVIDPKGELAAVTARARSAVSHVHIINPWNAHPETFASLGFAPDTYNPLDVLDRFDPNLISRVGQMAAAICPNDGEGKDRYWNQAPEDLLTAVLLWLVYDPKETKTLGRAREIVTLPRRQLREKFLDNMMGVRDFGGAMREKVGQFIDLAPDTYSSVISSLSTFTSFLSDPQVKAAVSRSTFPMSDLTGLGQDRPTTVYLVTPPEGVTTQTTWLRLMFSAAITAFKRKGADSPFRCMFLIDEFANLGFLREMKTEITLTAGYGVDLALIIQDLNQLEVEYGKTGRTIMANCAYKWFCNADDPDTLKYISEALGDKTVRTISTGETEGETKGGRYGHSQEGKSTTYGEMGRRLLQPSEVKNLGPDAAILFAPQSRPQFIRPVDYWRLPEAFAHMQNACPNLFWVPPLQYDANPLVPESRGTGFMQGVPGAPGAPRKPVDYGLYSPANQNKPRPAKDNPPQTEPEARPNKQGYDYGLYSPAKKPPKS